MRCNFAYLSNDVRERIVWATFRLFCESAKFRMDLANGLHWDRLRGFQLCAHRGNQCLDEAVESPINLGPQFEVVRIIGKTLKAEVDSLLETSRFPERLYVRPCHCKSDLIV